MTIPCLMLLCALAMAAGCGGEKAGDGPVGRAAFAAGDDCCTSHLECQDGVWCNGIEYCNCWGVCMSGPAPNCEDGNPGTADSCVNDYVGTPGVRGVGGALGQNGEVGIGHCDHVDISIPCTTAADCNDYNACTSEVCQAGFCKYGTVACNDSDPCTSDSCDPAMGCVFNVLQNCCVADGGCDDRNVCTTDRCDLSSHLCYHTARPGASCPVSNPCYNFGSCGTDGVCYPGPLQAPVNDTCTGMIDVVTGSLGEGCITATTDCASNQTGGTCDAGSGPDLVYRFTYPVNLGASVVKKGREFSAKDESNTCAGIDGDAVQSCTNMWWEYRFYVPENGDYWLNVETSNYAGGGDLVPYSVFHRMSIYSNGVLKGEIANLATAEATHQTGKLLLGYLPSGNRVVRVYWTNDWYRGDLVPPLDSNLRVYNVSLRKEIVTYQLYSYNVLLDADFDTLLTFHGTCGSNSSQLACSDNCENSALLNCELYGLGMQDSGLTIPPFPVGQAPTYYINVDGKGGGKGPFQLLVDRIQHANNPCADYSDDDRVVDATAGGEFRGNVDGYANDAVDSLGVWQKTECHSYLDAGADWPGPAWFALRPAADTTYCVTTNEVQPQTWFDTVIAAYNNTMAGGCFPEARVYMGCAHIEGRNGMMNPTQLQLTAYAGQEYLVSVSSFQRPSSGNYVVTFQKGACALPCAAYGGVLEGDHCYRLWSATAERKGYKAAEAACETWAPGGRLVSIGTEEEQAFVKALAAGNQVWIGINDLTQEGIFQWVTNEPLEYSNWYPGEPNNSGGIEDYGMMYADGRWNDCGETNCGATMSYVCEMPCENCAPACSILEAYNFEDHCYRKFTVPVQWPAARDSCRAWVPGGHLATITSQAENDFIFATFAAGSGQNPWIGMSDIDVEGTYTWVTGEPVVYTNWVPGEPNDWGGNEDWIQMYGASGQWNDCGSACSTWHYVCEYP